MRNVSVVRDGVRILRDIDLSVAVGESLAIVGPNGSGKTTLVGILRGEILPYYDEEKPAETELFGEKRWNLFNVRSRMGVVSMDLQNRIPDDSTLSEVILSGFFGSTSVFRIHKVEGDMLSGVASAARTMGLEDLLDAPFGRLSMGEKRRGLIARALAPGPGMLLLDEPMTGLDVVMKDRFRQMFGIMMAAGMGIILITHDLEEIPRAMDRVVMLKDGTVFADGAKDRLLNAHTLSRLFDEEIEVTERDGIYSMGVKNPTA